jgi:hypothetical protein
MNLFLSAVIFFSKLNWQIGHDCENVSRNCLQIYVLIHAEILFRCQIGVKPQSSNKSGGIFARAHLSSFEIFNTITCY